MLHDGTKGYKSIKFTANSLKCWESFIEFQNSGNIISMAINTYHIQKYSSTVVSSSSQISKTITVRC